MTIITAHHQNYIIEGYAEWDGSKWRPAARSRRSNDPEWRESYTGNLAPRDLEYDAAAEGLAHETWFIDCLAVIEDMERCTKSTV